MTDRELLELAARAAGIEIVWNVMINRHHPIIAPKTTHEKMWIGHVHQAWNPLEDDSDAFRLAVKLKMDVQNSIGDRCRAEVWNDADYLPAEEAHGDDPCAATRRAITRAAAAIAQEPTNAQG